MQVPPYARRKDFTQDDGDQTDHAALNAEFDAASVSIQRLRSNLGLLQRDDGQLQDGLVNADTLHPAFKAKLIKQLSGSIDSKLNEAQAAASAATIAAKTSKNAEQASKEAQVKTETAQRAAQLNAQASADSSAQALNAKESAIAAQNQANFSSKQAQAAQEDAKQSAKLAAEQAQAASLASIEAKQASEQSLQGASAASHSANTAQSHAEIAISAALDAKKKVDEAIQLGTPADYTVTTDKLVKGAVTTSKLAAGAVTLSKLAQDLGATYSLANPGYIQFPAWFGGLVMQWGVAHFAWDSLGNRHISVDPDDVWFPLRFPNEVLTVQLTTIEKQIFSCCGAVDQAKFTIDLWWIYEENPSVKNCDVKWFALGY